MMMIHRRTVLSVALVLALMATLTAVPGLSNGPAVQAQRQATSGTGREPGAVIPKGWAAVVQAYINEDLGLSGTNGLSTTPNWFATGENDGEKFGYSVAAAGDVNGDGYADVVVGAYGFASGADNGKAYAFYGSATGLPTTPNWTSTGENDGGFGYSVAGAGDINGDGYADVIVAAPLGLAGGKVYVFHGSASGLDTTWAGSIAGEHEYDHFGNSVAGAGDVNGDGYADIIVGCEYYGDFFGKVYVYHGSASGLGTTADWSVVGESAYLYLGKSVAGAGDVNGDGYADVILSSVVYFDSRGIAYVYHGSSSGLDSDWSWSDAGEYAYDWFGRSVAGAGDVNGDGYGDIIVGADGFDGDDDDDGRAYVYYGAAGGLDADPGWSYEGLVPSVQDRLGRSVASAGDVNGDGYADVVIGSNGRALLFYGATTGPGTGWPDWFPEGESASDEFGYSVAGAGDVNGDGYADVIVGAYGYDAGAERGKAYVYHGAGGPPSAFSEWSDLGTYTGDRFGRSVASAGDVNGDGYSDVIVGAPGYPGPSGEQGEVRLYLGSAGGPATTPSWSAGGEHDGDWFGSPVAAAGDVNGDGYGDIIIGAWKYDNGAQEDAGKVYVYHGSASGLEATAAWSVAGDHEYLYFGVSVAGAGDVNGDGYADVIVGASDGHSPGQGMVHVYHGSASGLSLTPNWTQTGEQDWDHFGSSVAGAGDVNGDGYADVVIGTPFFGTEHGKVYAYHGSSSGLGTTAAWSVAGLDPTDQVGYSVAGAGDVNGDSYADVIIGALKTPTVDNPGRAYVFTGSASGLNTSAAWSTTGESNGDEFGYSVAGIGDVNGDGFADVAAGARGCSSDRGRIYVHFGSATGPDNTVDSSTTGESEGDNLGYSVAGAGDVNGDGFADVIAGAPFRDESATSAGKAYVYLGNDDPGRPVVPQQARADGSRLPVQPWGLSYSSNSFYLGTWATDPMGRGRVKLEVEACPAGVAFGDVACIQQRSLGWRDVTVTKTGVQVFATISGLEGETLYRWRVRVLHAPYTVTEAGITPPPNPAHGPWRRFLGQGMEADLRTTEAAWKVFLPLALKGQ